VAATDARETGAIAGDTGADAGAAVLATYTLDLTRVRQPWPGAPAGEVVGVAVFGAGALAAFPVDLATTTKHIGEKSWDTVGEWPSTLTCAGFPADRAYVADAERGSNALEPLRPQDLFKNFRSPYKVRLRALDLEMPYRVSQDGTVRVPGGLCVAMRQTTPDGWVWRARRFEPAQDAAGERATAHLDLEVNAVDAVAILFEAATALSQVRYTIERAADPAASAGRGEVAGAACCMVCAPDGPDLASRYCCTREPRKPEPCIDEEIPVGAACLPERPFYDQARTACRARSLWLRDFRGLDPGNVCVGPDRLSPTGIRGLSYRCCRDDYFVPPPPAAGPAPDCQLTGGSADPCKPNAEMLAIQVEACYRAGLIHRSTVFANDCPGGGSHLVTSVCCRPGVTGPPADYCTM
jgi:hypothetical protein